MSESDPSRDMSKYGFKKELTYRYLVEKESGVLMVDEFDFYVDDMPCRGCGSEKFEWLYADRSGVLLLCCYCEQVNGAMNKEIGRFRKSYQVTLDEAITLLKSQGWRENDRPIRSLRHRYAKKPKELVDKPRPEA